MKEDSLPGEALQTAIFNSVNFSSIATDARGVIQIFNVGAEKMLGYTASEVVNLTPAALSDNQEMLDRAKTLTEEFGVKISPGFDALIYKASRGIEDIYGLTLIRKDGTRFPAMVSVTALRDKNDTVIGYLLIGTDNTARKQAEDERKLAGEEIQRLNKELENRIIQLESVNKELEAFSYSISHDLRSPLRAISGFAQALLEDYTPQIPAGAVKFANTIRDAAVRMGHLIDDLLAFSHIGRMPLQSGRVDMKRLALEAYENLHEERKGHTIKFSCDELPYCTGDPALLSQVWTNLISNAIKFSSKRDPAEIKIRYDQAKGGTVYSVSDNGTGFDMRYMAKLFGVFERLHHTEDYAGTGVGLAIVKRIVTRHGGRVWVEAKENEGATFFFTTNGETP